MSVKIFITEAETCSHLDLKSVCVLLDSVEAGYCFTPLSIIK